MTIENTRCHCGSSQTFSECCQPVIQQQSAETAEQLMRSRYSAFCSNRADYLVATHHPITPSSRETIQQTIDKTDWLGLKVLCSGEGGAQDQSGWVEFVAFYTENGVQQIHEKSRFRRIDGKWFYIGGEFLPPYKIGRNDPCICGSGKKFKKCHG